jgi:hypothetical protein
MQSVRTLKMKNIPNKIYFKIHKIILKNSQRSKGGMHINK